MLTLLLSPTDDFPAVEVQLEHSLVSLSKWESVYRKPFFNKEEHTPSEFMDYISMMRMDSNPPESFVSRLSVEQFREVREYINQTQTATTFREDPNQPPSREIITNEIIYYWLVTFRIPFHPVETWHLSRLMTLVRVCGLKQSKPKKMTQKQQMAEYRRLNEERRRELGTTG